MAELLLASAHCESLPRMNQKLELSNNEEWEQELINARSCRESLKVDHGIPSPLRQWLARLVSTRRTIIIPTANALGYSQNKREEGNIDPNRDFPFDIEQYHEDECMQTIAGRSINELWRSHLFQIGLTFHGGMEVIGYEWGAPTYLNYNAPDALAQEQIANAYSRYSNGFHGHSAYDYGTMNDKVYYVRGVSIYFCSSSIVPSRITDIFFYYIIGNGRLGLCRVMGSRSCRTMYPNHIWWIST